MSPDIFLMRSVTKIVYPSMHVIIENQYEMFIAQFLVGNVSSRIARSTNT